MKRELLKYVTKETTLGQCLEYACNIEGNLQSVELSKYVDKIQVSSTGSVTSNVDAVNKKKTGRHDVTPARQNMEDEKPKCDKCGLKHKPKDCPAFGKVSYHCGKGHYSRLCRVKAKGIAKKVAELEYEEYDFDGVDTQHHELLTVMMTGRFMMELRHSIMINQITQIGTVMMTGRFIMLQRF